MAGNSDVAVIGAGIVGLATAHAVREAGASVRVFERGVPGAAQSGGDSRLFRHAHDDPRMVAFAQRSRAIYREWEERFGVELVSGDGALTIGPTAERRLPTLQAAGVRARAVGAAEVAERLPLLAAWEGPALFDEEAGAIRAAAAVAALADEVRADLVADEAVALWPTTSGSVEVRTGAGRSEHGAAVVCAGLHSARFARDLGVEIPLEVGLHGRASFRVHGEPPAQLACLQDSSGAFGQPDVYGAPSPGNGRYSIGVGISIPVREDGSVTDPAGLAALTDRAAAYVRRALPGLDSEPVELRHCWTTPPAWSEDGIGVWRAGNVHLVAGDNLFKHAPALGRALAEAALGSPLLAELGPAARLAEPVVA